MIRVIYYFCFECELLLVAGASVCVTCPLGTYTNSTGLLIAIFYVVVCDCELVTVYSVCVNCF